MNHTNLERRKALRQGGTAAIFGLFAAAGLVRAVNTMVVRASRAEWRMAGLLKR